jgi:hypothetical protein
MTCNKADVQAPPAFPCGSGSAPPRNAVSGVRESRLDDTKRISQGNASFAFFSLSIASGYICLEVRRMAVSKKTSCWFSIIRPGVVGRHILLWSEKAKRAAGARVEQRVRYGRYQYLLFPYQGGTQYYRTVQYVGIGAKFSGDFVSVFSIRILELPHLTNVFDVLTNNQSSTHSLLTKPTKNQISTPTQPCRSLSW